MEEKIKYFSEEFIKEFSPLEESQFKLNSLSDEDADKLFQGFHDAYTKSVGASWDRDTFDSRAWDWTFFGSVDGGVALRHQRSGLWKLNASYGQPMKVMRGLQEMLSSIGSQPIWGAMTEDICKMLEKATKGDFKRPPKLMMKLLFPYLKKSMGVNSGVVTSNGGVIIDTPAGKMEKLFIANKAYYTEILNNMDKYLGDHNIPAPIKNTLVGLLKKLV